MSVTSAREQVIPRVSPGHLLGAYETWMRSWGASERTVDQRLRFVRGQVDAWGPVGAATPAVIQDLLANPALSPWSRSTYHNHLSAWFGWLAGAGHIGSNPMDGIRRPRTPRSAPRPLAPAEVEAALGAARGNLRVFLLLALYAGLRAHEIAKVRGEDVTEETIYVKGKGGKEAYVPTHPLIWEAASDYPSRGWWFPSSTPLGHVCANSVGILVGRLFDRLGIDGSIHRARHAYATTLLRAGANIRVVQTLMRHESLATTAAYCAVDEDERRDAIALLG